MKWSDAKSGNQRPELAAVLKRAYLGVALTAVVLAGLSLTLGGLLALSRIAEHNLMLLGRSLSYTVEAAVMFRDAEAAQEIVSEIASTEEVSFIEVTDRDGNLLAQWHSGNGLLNTLERWVLDLFLPPTLELPIYYEGSVIGNLVVEGAGGSLTAFLISGVMLIFAALLLSAFCAFLLSRRILQGIIVPIEQLTMVARRIRDERAFDERLPSADIAELDELSSDFNELLEELGGWEARWREENALLSHKVRHDSLTGLSSRASFESQLGVALHDARIGSHKLALLYIDGDGFKQINDRLGHAGGDAALVELAARLRRYVRAGDLVARLGGDEFAILTTPLNRLEDALAVADHIQESMKEPIAMPDGQVLTLSVSIGVAVFPDHADNSDDLLNLADEAMYMAKRSAHSPWVVNNKTEERQVGTVGTRG